jgi:hypothetical protein
MNDNSMDNTQCILDAYAREGVVICIPQDIVNLLGYNLTDNMDIVFDVCSNHLATQQKAT